MEILAHCFVALILIVSGYLAIQFGEGWLDWVTPWFLGVMGVWILVTRVISRLF